MKNTSWEVIAVFIANMVYGYQGSDKSIKGKQIGKYNAGETLKELFEDKLFIQKKQSYQEGALNQAKLDAKTMIDQKKQIIKYVEGKERILKPMLLNEEEERLATERRKGFNQALSETIEYLKKI